MAGSKAWWKKYYQKNKVKQRERFLQSKYGITSKDYEQMLSDQDNKCAICGIDADIRIVGKTGKRKQFRLAVDHDHETGRVRALLCNKCNMFVGHIENNKDILPTVLKYLQA